VRAARADVATVISGQRLFTGNAALEKAQEVASVVAALEHIGVGEVELVGIHAHVSSGLLGRYSRATYVLRARVEDMELLPLLFEAITTQKHATLAGIDWEFEPTPAQTSTWLEGCVARARHSADVIASAMGRRIAGVHRCEARVLGRRAIEPDAVVQFHGDMPMSHAVRCAKAQLTEERALGGAHLAPRRSMGVVLEIAFSIEPSASA